MCGLQSHAIISASHPQLRRRGDRKEGGPRPSTRTQPSTPALAETGSPGFCGDHGAPGCSPQSAPPGNLPAARPSAAPCCRGVDTAGPPTRLRIGHYKSRAPRPRLLSGFFDHAPEGSSGAGANPRCCCQGCTAGGKAWPGWMGCSAPAPGSSGCRGAKVPRRAATPRHAPGPPHPKPRASQRRGNHLLPAVAGRHPKIGLIPFRLWPPRPAARDWELAKLVHGSGAVSPYLFRDRNLGHLGAAAPGLSCFCRWGPSFPPLPVSPGREGRDVGGAPGVLEAGDII